MAFINKDNLIAALSTLTALERELTEAEAAQLDVKFAANGREDLLFVRGGSAGRAVLFGNDRHSDNIVVYEAPARNFDEHNLPFDSEEFDEMAFRPGAYTTAALHIAERLFPDREDGEVAALRSEPEQVWMDYDGNLSTGANGWRCDQCQGTNPVNDYDMCDTPGCWGSVEGSGHFVYPVAAPAVGIPFAPPAPLAMCRCGKENVLHPSLVGRDDIYMGQPFAYDEDGKLCTHCGKGWGEHFDIGCRHYVEHTGSCTDCGRIGPFAETQEWR